MTTITRTAEFIWKWHKRAESLGNMHPRLFFAYSNTILAGMDGGSMQKKLPYYMVYPMPFVYDEDRIEERDIEYMKSLYPDVAKQLLPYVEEECDRMEYQNSMMYDEYPDRLQLRLMCRRVCDKVKKNGKILLETEYEDLVSVMLYEELMRRRRDHRRMGNRFY